MSLEKRGPVTLLRSFYQSRAYYFTIIVLSAIGVLLDIEACMSALIICILSVRFLVVKESAGMFYPIMFLIVTMMNAASGDLSRVHYLVYCAVPLIGSMIYNAVKHKKKFHKNSVFISMLVVSGAIMLGGLFSIRAEEYFAIGNLYYIAFLGLFMVALCAFIFTLWDGEDKECLRSEFINSICDSGIFLALVMVMYYLLNSGDVTSTWGISEVIEHSPFRNIAVSYYLLSMPFAFFRSRSKILYLFGGIVIYIACIVSGSRMGLVFGSMQFAVCMVYFIATVEKGRWIYVAVFAVIAAIMVLSLRDILDSYVERLTEDFGSGSFINMNESRIGMIRRAVKDFFSSPIFGKGLGYTGNEDLYAPEQAFDMHWYHNFIGQIIGSLGIVGIIAYMYQFYFRLSMVLKTTTPFGWLVGLMYIGVLLSGITDTGIFTPFPTVFLLNCAFMLLALSEADAKKGKASVRIPRRKKLS